MNTLSEYTYFFISKNVTYTLFYFFKKFFESLQCILIKTFNIPCMFLGGAPTSVCQFFCPFVCLSITHHISGTSGHTFWYLCAKWYLQVVFFFFILIFWAIRAVKGQKKAKWQILSTCFILQESYIIWLSLMVYTSVKWWYLQECFPFFQKFDFWGC